jgi:hypothetical protein
MPAFTMTFAYQQSGHGTESKRSKPYVVLATTACGARVRLLHAFTKAARYSATFSGAHTFCQCVQTATPEDEYECDDIDRALVGSLHPSSTAPAQPNDQS